jgi:hypothetical protein
MHRSSDSIGAIAAALAKAQAELTNPEKSLTATITTPGAGGGDRSFRYAPLSSGLDIVRKSLGRHEIAAVQTTAIDGDAGLVRLTTVLAHSSGEWISSEWPVCPVSEIAVPHRMGAALTYARRYGLFTLVGIAGEDDVDAPGTGPAQEAQGGGREAPLRTLQGNGRAPSRGNGFPRRPIPRRHGPRMPPRESAMARDKLITELNQLASSDKLTEWALRQMTTKNALIDGDADLVEQAFRSRLQQFGEQEPEATASTPVMADDPARAPPSRTGATALATAEAQAHRANADSDGSGVSGAASHRHTSGIDKSVLPIGERRRYRDKAHLKFVALKACLICGRQPSDPHHLRFAQTGALGRKVSDEFAVPLCRVHHREVHRSSYEPQWWKGYGLDPLPVAAALWERTRPSQSLAEPNLLEQRISPPLAAPLPSRPKRNRKTNPIGPMAP